MRKIRRNVKRIKNKRIQKYLKYINEYCKAQNAATGSKYDSNANVSNKNIATLNGELFKGESISINRLRMFNKLEELFGTKEAELYLWLLENHYIYRHDETNPLLPYCVSVSMYAFLFNGLKNIGGISEAPKNLQSFCGSFINFIFVLSSQFAGACLSGDQELLINKQGITHSLSIRDIVSSYDLDRKIINEKDWEVGIVTDDLLVWENGRYVKVNKVYRRKYDDKIYRIKTKTGKEVKCSKDHKFQVMRGGKLQEVKAEELNLFDTVVNTMTNFRVNKESVEYKNGQLYGIIAGDGCITNDNEVRVSIRYDQEWISELLDESFLRLYNKKGQLTDGHGAFDYRLCSKDIVSKIREVFLENKKCEDKQIDIKKYSLDFLMGFLDGILLTDGHLDSKTISLSLVNESLIQNVVDILKKVGIELMIKVESAHDNKKTLYSVQCPIKTSIYLKDSLRTQTGDPTKLNNLSVGIVDKRGYGIEVGYVGNSYSSHKKNEKDIRLASDLHWNKDFIPDVVCTIEVFDNDDDYVYEIETESHWYSAGGLLTHNCATPEFLTYFDYFARKEFGENYINTLDEVVFISDTKTKTISDCLSGYFQQIVYSINQPASARNFQSVFWNISYFDREYFKAIFENFVFPDGTEPNTESVMKLQLFFMKWFRDERKRSIDLELTFPVENGCAIDDGVNDYKDKDTMDKWAEIWASGHEFFLYHSSSADSLASCCRLSNGFSDNTFSTSMGVGGISTGSKGVITINFNRCIQDLAEKKGLYKVLKKDFLKMGFEECWMNEDNFERFSIPITVLTNHIHNFLIAWNEILIEQVEVNMMPIYTEGYISLEKQFLTIGINGFLESAEYLGIDITSEDYSNYAEILLSSIKEANKAAKTDKVMFNTEFVPAENLGIKHAKWDKEDGYFVPREVYNSYFYPVEDDSLNIYDRMALQGGSFAESLDGGSACHNNLKEPLTAKQYRTQMNNAVILGCPQFVNNVPNSICPKCNKKYKKMLWKCPVCGNEELEWETRIIGYWKRVSSWSEQRQKEHKRRVYK